LERDEQVAEWIKLTEESEVSAQVAPKPKSGPKGGRPAAGIRRASRELNIDRDEHVAEWISLTEESELISRQSDAKSSEPAKQGNKFHFEYCRRYRFNNWRLCPVRPAEFVSLTRTDPLSRALNYVRSVHARALSWAKFDPRAPQDIARERWGDAVVDTVIKTGIGAVSSGAVHEDQTAFFGVAAESTALGKIPLRRWNFRVRTLDSGGIVGGEVPEAAATPLIVPSLSTFRLTERKFQSAVLATREALERGGEAAEIGLRDDLLRATADAVDAAFVADLIAAADSSGFTGDHRFAVYLMHPADAAAYSDQRLDVRGGWFRGYPAIVSNAVTPGQAILFDASRVAAAWTGGEVDFAQHATVEADDAPAQNAATPTGPSGAIVSLFQTNTVAIRTTMLADWHIAGSVDVVELAS
jgi:hypothetical protein